MPEAASSPAPTAVSASPAASHRPPAIVVDRVSKTFRLPRQRYSTFKERALHPLRSREVDELRALQEVSLTVPHGEFFGIVGRNGSGKSTLLKCLAGIYEVDGGGIEVHGRLSPFIELGVGFNMDLTARDNVLINGVLLGLSRREARRRFDAIVAFAELEDFLDLKLKNYSSGMHVRLAFAVATQADADIILVDEVLAVGDAAFQQKCFDRFHELKAAGRTIVLVTHDMHSVERYCDRAMLIERGKVVDLGEPHDIALAYNEINFGRLVHTSHDGARYGDHTAAEIASAWFENADGRRIDALAQGEPLTMAMEVRFHSTLVEPVFGMALRNQHGHTVFASRTDYRGVRTGRYDAGDVATLRLTLENWFAPSTYRLTPALARAGAGTDAIDQREDIARITIHGTGNSGGVIDAPHRAEITRL